MGLFPTGHSSLYLCFQPVDENLPKYGFLFIYVNWYSLIFLDLYWSSGICKFVFSSASEKFGHYFHKYFFCPIFCLLSENTVKYNLNHLNMVPHMTESLFCFFFRIFSFLSSVLKFSINLPQFHCFLYLAISNLLLFPSSKFFISEVVYFISKIFIWFFFLIVCIFLLKFSNCLWILTTFLIPWTYLYKLFKYFYLQILTSG